jgi:hypothetical protein
MQCTRCGGCDSEPAAAAARCACAPPGGLHILCPQSTQFVPTPLAPCPRAWDCFPFLQEEPDSKERYWQQHCDPASVSAPDTLGAHAAFLSRLLGKSRSGYYVESGLTIAGERTVYPLPPGTLAAKPVWHVAPGSQLHNPGWQVGSS